MRVCYLILSLFGGFAGLLAPSLPAVGQAKDAKTNVRLKSAAGASAPIKVHWQTPEVVNSEPLDASSIAFNTAPDGSAATALFNRQTLALDSTTQAMSAVRLGSMRIPLTVPAGKRLVGFRTDVRGFAAKSGASRIVLVVDLGGVTKTVEYGYGKPHNGAFTFSAASASPLQGKKGRKRTPVPIKGLRATGITNYVATILFSLQRTDASAQATLAIDSLDVVPILH